MATTQVNLRLDDELLARVNRARGDVPRERWLRLAVEAYLGLQGEGKPGATILTDESITISHRVPAPAARVLAVSS